jgi:RNA polymerase sigma factor (sigma-70 family)
LGVFLKVNTHVIPKAGICPKFVLIPELTWIMETNVNNSYPNSEQTLYRKDLWTKFRKGDTHAFELIARENYRPLFNYGLRICSDEDLVHDCIQELFLELWERRERLSDADYVRTYLLRAVRNKIVKEGLRLRRVKKVEELAFEPLHDLSIESQIVENEHKVEMALRLKETINKLTKRQREVIYLRFYQNLEFEEISRVMEMNRQSVANLLHRSIKEIKINWSLLITPLLHFFLR